jgi:hypothetical protein
VCRREVDQGHGQNVASVQRHFAVS